MALPSVPAPANSTMTPLILTMTLIVPSDVAWSIERMSASKPAFDQTLRSWLSEGSGSWPEKSNCHDRVIIRVAVVWSYVMQLTGEISLLKWAASQDSQ